MPPRKTGSKSAGVMQVAKEAGVSAATVSRAYNDPAIVKESVRQKIYDVAARLDYSPNPAARALRSRRSHIVGAAIPTLDYAIFATMLNRFQSRMVSHGATTIVMTTGFDNTAIYDSVRMLVDRGAEALLLVGEVEDTRLKQYLSVNPIPVVTTYSAPPDDSVPAIGFHNYNATVTAVEHLIGLGHREFAMIAANTHGNDRQRARIAAYRDTLAREGLNGADRIYTHAFDMHGGVEVMEQILTDFPETTAVVCNTDLFAIGAIRGCKNRGLDVPRDISIIGCDDFEFAELLDPPLTTIAVPAVEMGGLAADALWDAIKSGEKVKGKVVPTELKVRGSTARLRA